MARRSKVHRSNAVGGRTLLVRAPHWRDELNADFNGGKAGARRWVRRTERQELRTGRRFEW